MSLLILLADDDAIVRRVLRRTILGVHPEATVVEAADGTEVDRQLARFDPSLVILDIHLPGDDGLEVCGRIRRRSGMGKTTVLMITGDDAEDARQRAYNAGADGFLVKPFADGSFLTMISRLAAGGSARTAPSPS